MRNALQILSPLLAEYASQGDDPSIVISLEDAGYIVEQAARRIRKAVDQLEAAPPFADVEQLRELAPDVAGAEP